MSSAGRRMKPETGQQRRLVRAVCSRRGDGAVVPFQAVRAPDWVPSQFWCHANTRAWVDRNPDWKVVHGWLMDEKGDGSVELFAHSVVARPDGVLVDVTPSPLPPVLPFIAHRGPASDYAEFITDNEIVSLIFDTKEFTRLQE